MRVVAGKKGVQIGDLLAITAAPGLIAAGKVIYLSEYFRHVMAVRVFDCVFDHIPTEAELPVDATYLDDLIYTGSQSVSKDWRIIGRRETSAEELQLTRRLVAGDVYIGDENLGRASDDDRRRLRSMGVAGMYAVHDSLARKLKDRKAGCK